MTHFSSDASASSVAAPSAVFSSLGLAPQLLDILSKNNFVTPTPIQQQAIPVAMTGVDVLGIAQTGTGKTLAFGLPMLHRWLENNKRSRGLVILPTRELALQVDETLQKVGGPLGLRTAVLIGGAPMRPQYAQLRNNPDIIVATPGRLIDHLQNRVVDLRTVETLVLDEADRMLDMGFAPQIAQILRGVPDERQTMLFSATMPDAVLKIAHSHMTEPTRVEVAQTGTTAEGVSQELYVVGQDDKLNLLAQLLHEERGTVLIFARTRSRAHKVSRDLKRMGHTAAEIHSDRTLSQRREALDGFKSGRFRILVATDIAARGIDVKEIALVVNYDLPDSAEDYVHRIGRTARAGKTGRAVAFSAPDQGAMVREIQKLIRAEIPVSPNSPEQLPPAPVAQPRRGTPRGNGGRPRTQSFGARRGPSRPNVSRPNSGR